MRKTQILSVKSQKKKCKLCQKITEKNLNFIKKEQTKTQTLKVPKIPKNFKIQKAFSTEDFE